MDQFAEKWLFDPTVGKFVTAILGILIVVILVRFSQRSLGRYIKDTDTRYKTRKFVTFLGYIIAVMVLATVFSEKLGGIHVALGVAGAGIAFALQEVIASVAGWFAISFARFYKTGDRVQLGGIKGDVIDIGILRTTIMEIGDWVKGDLYNGRVVRVANSFVFKEPVFNYSGDFPFLWDEITMPIKYGSKYKQAKEIIEKIALEVVGDYVPVAQKAWKELVKKFMIENSKIEPMVSITADENWMTFTLRYVVDFKSRRTIKNILFTRIVEEIEKTNGTVNIASTAAEINLTPSPFVKVQMASAN